MFRNYVNETTIWELFLRRESPRTLMLLPMLDIGWGSTQSLTVGWLQWTLRINRIPRGRDWT